MFGDGVHSPKSVVIGEPLATVLRRRFVKISDVYHDEAADSIVVTAKLPLVLGTQRIVLTRAIRQPSSVDDMLVETCEK